ncbi:ChaN family lipoprotein [Polynucleobacter sp. CS-Odin-A6]|uniref:ChaN family lipoprotein n=1 Tax=Polynucleobacter sp. CS-Odin-A6 TaxID=2689106 RepID=UPI001C0BD3E7|nr:ChaN family lipoprotein [Polynucleobacter sp. CS-Odin-A6]MBU3620735.1 ChaN family lipoprotein [Polynucleobacter sp. CS-Odin-A6]
MMINILPFRFLQVLLAFLFTFHAPVSWADKVMVKSEPPIFSLTSLKAISKGALIAQLSQKDVIILGEVHDNVEHHRIHGQLINEISDFRKVASGGKKDQVFTSIIVEHLDAGNAVQFDASLERSLTNAGFNPQSWVWPTHEPLFSAIASSGLSLRGGSLSSSAGKEIYSSNGASAPAHLKLLLERATLSDASQKKLHKEIQDGHCGLFPENKIPQMAQVQRARDASLAYEAIQYAPSILIVGNGHAWNDIGVPQVIRANYPKVSLASVIYIEDEGISDPQKLLVKAKQLSKKADYVWFTSTMDRKDPCEKLR